MRAKWMGVALAAVMSCGWASGAEAAFILDVNGFVSPTFGGPDYAYDTRFLLEDNVKTSATNDFLVYLVNGPIPGLYPAILNQSSNSDGTSNVSFNLDALRLFNPPPISPTNDSGLTQINYDFQFSLKLKGVIDLSGASNQLFGASSISDPTGFIFQDAEYQFGSIPINFGEFTPVSIQIETVPLPSSSPLLFAALAFLGLIGCKRRGITFV